LHNPDCSRKKDSSYMSDVQSIFERKNQNGGEFWSRIDGDIHAPHGYSTIDTLTVLGELGVTAKDNNIISKAIEFVFTYQARDGCFKYSKKSSKLPCMTARILSAIGRLDSHYHERAEKSYQQLLESQWSDGGWRCNTVKIGKTAQSDASNPSTTLYVLDAFRFRNNSVKDNRQLEKGVDFLLQHWVSRKPNGPCNFGIGSRFLQIEYPFLRYNIFYFVYVLSFYANACKDHRFLEAYEHLANKTVNNELFPENPHSAWKEFDFATKQKVSVLGTKRWLEIISNIKND